MGGSKKFRNKFRIASARLLDWDYSSNGYYFVTICTDKRRHFFGFIYNGIMCVNTPGTIVHHCWQEIARHSNHACLDAFVVMPNHVHAIVAIDHGRARNAGECGKCRGLVELQRDARDEACLVSSETATSKIVTSKPANPSPKPGISPKFGSLSAVIGSFKSACTKHIRRIYPDIGFAWQTRFYDCVVRDDRALHNIRWYIFNNPRRWKQDIFLY